MNNLIMDNVICPFTLNLYYFCGPKGKEKYVWDKILTQSLRRLLSLGEFILSISPREMFMLLLVLFMVYLNNSFQISRFMK